MIRLLLVLLLAVPALAQSVSNPPAGETMYWVTAGTTPTAINMRVDGLSGDTPQQVRVVHGGAAGTPNVFVLFGPTGTVAAVVVSPGGTINPLPTRSVMLIPGESIPFDIRADQIQVIRDTTGTNIDVTVRIIVGK